MFLNISLLSFKKEIDKEFDEIFSAGQPFEWSDDCQKSLDD
jgi:hypothetical protein